MSARLPPSGRTSRGSVTETRRSAFSAPQKEGGIQRSTSFNGGSSGHLSEGRRTPATGVRSVNMVIEQHNREISGASAGRRGLIVANTQAELEGMRENVSEKLKTARGKLEIMKKNPNTPIKNMNDQKKIIEKYENRLRTYDNAVETALGQKRERPNSGSVQSHLKRTKSTEELPIINNKPRNNVTRPTAIRPSNFLSQLKRATGKINRSKETVIETQAPPKKTQQPKTPKRTQQPKTPKMTSLAKNTQQYEWQEEMQEMIDNLKKLKKGGKVTNDIINKYSKRVKVLTSFVGANTKEITLFNKMVNDIDSFGSNNPVPAVTNGTSNRSPTPSQIIRPSTTPPSQMAIYLQGKKEGSEEMAKIRKEVREMYGSPRKRLEPLFNKIAESSKTPPGVTKTNLKKFLEPFKQPISIKFAPSIQATGGNATIIQTKNKKNDDKKKKPVKKFDVLADPVSAYRKSVAASKRKEIMTILRTPTIGQRKKHVIQLIDKELRLMKVPKDIERKMISLYSKALSEKQIKQLFGGRSTADVKKILKKQVDYFKKKKR